MPGVDLPPHLRLGTSSFSSEDWIGNFYPAGTEPADFLRRYAEKLDAVEIDATFYRIPSPKQVAQWCARTPERFTFAAKIPQSVTHADDEAKSFEDLDQFLDVMQGLGPKLGPLLFQFPYVSKARNPEEYATGARFRERLAGLLGRAPRGIALAVEIRNEKWVAPPLLDLLRARGSALAFIDYYTTPGMARIALRPQTATARFAYVRFLGNHREMDAVVEEKAKAGGRRWDEIVRDRTRELRAWVPAIRDLAGRVEEIFVFFNNHYAGHAPASIELFRSVWAGTG